MPLWPDKPTPVRFGGYGKSNKIVEITGEKKQINQGKSSAKSKVKLQRMKYLLG